MKKLNVNFILSKKHIIFAAMVLVLGLAVYLNLSYLGSDTGFTDSDGLIVPTDAEAEDEDVTSYGEAYFAEAKLSRTKSRDEAIEAMKYMLSEADLSVQEQKALTLKAAQLAKSIETEGKIENFIKAKGFSDCMVYLEPDKIDVLVKSDKMSDIEASQIKDVILNEIELPNENISIIEIK